MTTPVLIDCDPGHDDAIAILLALASPEIEVLGITTVAGNQTLEKTTTNALKILEFTGRTEIPVAAGAARPLVREPYVAAHVHGETRHGRPRPARPRDAAGRSARRRLPRRADRAGRRARPDRPAHEYRPAPRTPSRGRGTARPDRAHGRSDRRGQRHAGRRVQHLGRPRGRGARVHERHRPDHDRPRRDPQGAVPAGRLRARSQRPAAPASSSPSSSPSTSASTRSSTAGTARPCTTRSPSRT